MVSDETITWGELLQVTVVELGNEQEARWLCEHASGLDRVELDAARDEVVSQRCGVALRAMVTRRLTGEPLQYVMKSWAFRDLDVLVDNRVLIPRPETEVVVQAALDLAREMISKTNSKLRVADLGTGSGVIGLSLASELPRGTTEVWLTDLSADALEVARANLAGLGLINGDVRVAQGSWFAALPSELKNSFDLIVSNPPYIGVYDPSVESSVLNHEPHLALFAGSDGLDAYREIISHSGEWLATDGWIVLEIGHQQGDAVRELLAQNSFKQIEIR
ncbi:MAG: peptide chain release factor N(5)-glutamine methyltransferase, partial [Actinomycetota bacterium]|nr:peptide chain release factor N(5)-glutamine methyltransferase [Actinomycetota bacterium]